MRVWHSVLATAAIAGAMAATPERPAVGALLPRALLQTVPDEVYLQEVGQRISSPTPLTAVGAHAGEVFAATKDGLLQLQGTMLVSVPGPEGVVTRFVQASGALWALTTRGAFRREGAAWKPVTAEALADLAEHRGELLAASGGHLWRIRGDRLEPLGTNPCPFSITRIVSHCGSIFVHGPGRLTMFERGRFGGRDMYDFPADQAWDWGALPSPETRDALSLGNRLFLATDRGLGVLRGMSLTALRGEEGLPFEDTRCLAAGFTNDLWIGTSRGLIRFVGNSFHYFAGQRWLPDDRVHALAVAGQTVYAATEGGLGIVAFEPFTLQKKAAFYERHLEEWGQKRLGLVHKLEWDDGLKQFVREAGDNDGGYSGDYLAAESYRYAVTKDPEARREATNTFHALRWLAHLTRIAGFPARSVWVKGERGHKSTGGSGGYPAEWHDAADTRFEWKGDTSSDELCSHFYATSVFLEHAAQGSEAAQAGSHLTQIASHLVDHGWQLVDLDGKPTRWGRWDPDYFLTDEGRYDRGLQCLEILSFMKTAAVISSDPRFATAYDRLIGLGYPGHTLRQRNTAPPDSVLHFEDQLAFWCYWNLLRHEQDPDLLSLYRRSLERTWEILRIEQQPWLNFVYGALTGNDCEPAPAVAHLREWPLDLVIWSYRNSHRADLRTPPGYVALKAGTRPFSPREREPMRWDAWTMQSDGGTGGRDVVEPSSWLLAYWMGRYYGFILPPTATDPAVLTVERNRGRQFGAAPYAGPARPADF